MADKNCNVAIKGGGGVDKGNTGIKADILFSAEKWANHE
jgi:hypothetical protein